ncbi:nodulation protein NfeD [bacterium]|nr:nodulation protein NfeD [bacterium]
MKRSRIRYAVFIFLMASLLIFLSIQKCNAETLNSNELDRLSRTETPDILNGAEDLNRVDSNRLEREKDLDSKDIVYHIKIDGEIDLGLSPFIRRVINDADKNSVRAVILEINTFGGRLDAAVQIRDALINASTFTIAYVNERAISAGALISIACRKIAMAPAATIGAATPVSISPLDQEVKPASEKVISYFRKEMKATAEKNGRPALIAEAMVDQDVVIDGLTEKGKLLTLTTSEAVQHKLADIETDGGIQGVLNAFDIQQGMPVTVRLNWAEKFLRIISGSMISSLLLTIGIIGLFLEFKTPTWGVAGTVGLICLILFFWGHWVVNLVGWEEILLLSVGAFLLILEVFVLPGFGIAGILGILTLALALIMSLISKNPSPAEIWSAVSHISIVFACAIVLFIIFAGSMAKTIAAKRFVLHTQARKDSNAVPPEIQTLKSQSPRGITKDETTIQEAGAKFHKNLDSLNQKPEDLPVTRDQMPAPKQACHPGMEGFAYTNLRPAGKGIFGRERLNVVTEGDFLEKGTPIRIIRVEGSNIIVQKIKSQEKV